MTFSISCHIIIVVFVLTSVSSPFHFFILEKASLSEKKIRQIEQLEKQLASTITEYEIKLPTDAVSTEFSPIILEPLIADYSISTDDLQHFQVSVVAKPEPEVAWYKDGVEIGMKEMKARFYSETHDNARTYGLLLSPTDFSDSGKYEFRAWNRLGAASCRASLSVRGKHLDDFLRFNDTISYLASHDSLIYAY